jgi:hypothetical protein
MNSTSPLPPMYARASAPGRRGKARRRGSTTPRRGWGVPCPMPSACTTSKAYLSGATRRRPNTQPWSSARRITSAPATSSRSSSASVSRPNSSCRPRRSTARSGEPTRRPICTSSISASSRSPDRARRSWSGCRTARSPSARSPARASAARLRRATRNWPTSCCTTPRNWPSILCFSTWGGTTWDG